MIPDFDLVISNLHLYSICIRVMHSCRLCRLSYSVPFMPLLLMGTLILLGYGNHHNLVWLLSYVMLTSHERFDSHITPPCFCWMPGVRKCRQELKRLREVLIKLREEETKLKEKQGNEGRIRELFEEQRTLRQEQRKLRIEEPTLLTERKTFYEVHGIPLEEDERKRPNNSDFADADSGSNYDAVSTNFYNNNDAGNCGGNDQVCAGGEHYSYGHDERQVQRGHDNDSNGERQGNSQGQPRMKVYVRKVTASSDAETEAEEKPESASVTEEKAANTDNAVAAPASESDKSAG